MHDVDAAAEEHLTRSEAEWDELASSLNAWGVLHVAPGRPLPIAARLGASEVFERLLKSGDVRLRQAFVVLLLTHPELSAHARLAIERLPTVDQEQAMRRYVAAAALQRMARTRIELRLGPQSLIPPDYVEDLGLPSLEGEYGRIALLAVAAQEQDRWGYDAWGTYVNLLEHFLANIRHREWGAVCVDEPTETV